MTTRHVKTQAELDQALADRACTEIAIDSPWGCWLSLASRSSATVRAYGSATVEAYGSATVEAHGSATVRAHGSATVEAHDSATVRAHDSATVRASGWAAVHIHSSRATVTGGHIIDITDLDLTDPWTWCKYHGIYIDDDGGAHLYKAVDSDLRAGHFWRLTTYTIGATIKPEQWRDDNYCGHGLHASPTTLQAHSHYPEATRFLEVVCPVADLRPIDAAKAKAPLFLVLREVSLTGSSLKQAGGAR